VNVAGLKLPNKVVSLETVILVGGVFLTLISGVVGAIGAQLLSIWHMRKLEDNRTALTKQLEAERQAFEIHRTKLDVLRKIAGGYFEQTST
jgi:hypothetical protein